MGPPSCEVKSQRRKKSASTERSVERHRLEFIPIMHVDDFTFRDTGPESGKGTPGRTDHSLEKTWGKSIF